MADLYRVFRFPLGVALAIAAFAVAWVALGVALFQPPGWGAYVLGMVIYVCVCGWVARMIPAPDAPFVVYLVALLLVMPPLLKLA